MEGSSLWPRAARVALVHDFLLDLRGAERVFLEMCDLWPDADVFTAVYDVAGTEGRFAHRNVRTSFLQRLRPTSRTFRALLPLYPSAIESLDFSGYDLVISSSSAWAHALICDEQTTHICYCHNPFRYVWNDRERTLAERRDPFSRGALRALFRRWRQWDWIAAQRVDRYIANSETTRQRIKTYFGREAEVVYPPVETNRFVPGAIGDYYVVLSELVPHKRIDRAVEAFNRIGRPLVVVGDGPDAARLRRLAGPGISFEGRVSDERVAQLLASCRALVQPSVEEFGIAAVEAQAAGRPVIAAKGGGALETIEDGVTGTHWWGGADDLARTVLEFDDGAIDPAACVENAARFGAASFRQTLPQVVNRLVDEVRRETGRRTPIQRVWGSRSRRFGLRMSANVSPIGSLPSQPEGDVPAPGRSRSDCA
ncbi:MAG TPA: glycosyltransferase [Thermoleophilaceae bacterium]